MLFADPAEPTEPLELSLEEIREFIEGTHARIQQVLDRMKEEEATGEPKGEDTGNS